MKQPNLVSSVPPAFASTQVAGVDGVPWPVTTLANMNIGGQYGVRLTFRFRAQCTSPLTSFRAFLTGDASSGNAGYAKGNGGRIHTYLVEDDGTPNHYPKLNVLADALFLPNMVNGKYYPNPDGQPNFPLITFPTPATPIAGNLYHIVFINEDATPADNYLSADFLDIEPSEPPIVPRLEWGYMHGFGAWNASSTWTDRSDILLTPVLELRYANGSAQGCGYVASGYYQPRPIRRDTNGTIHRVRQGIYSANLKRNITAVGVRLRSSAGATVEISLRDANGAALVSQTASVTSGNRWVWVEVPMSYNLALNTIYRLWVQPISGIAEATMAEDGESYMFTSGSTLSEPYEYAEYDDGTGWGYWQGYSDGHGSGPWGDMQFYMRLWNPIIG